MIREIIEKAAREKATLYCRTYLGGDHEIEPLTAYFRSTLIAILTDPQVGFKEALTIVSTADIAVVFQEEAEAKLRQLEELSK